MCSTSKFVAPAASFVEIVYCPLGLRGSGKRPTQSKKPRLSTVDPWLGPHAPYTITPLTLVCSAFDLTKTVR